MMTSTFQHLHSLLMAQGHQVRMESLQQPVPMSLQPKKELLVLAGAGAAMLKPCQ